MGTGQQQAQRSFATLNNKEYKSQLLSLNVSAIQDYRDDPNELDIYKSSRHLRNGSQRAITTDSNNGVNIFTQGNPTTVLKS